MSFRSSVSALALILVAACSQGSDIASPGATTPTTPPVTGGGGSGGDGGGSGATCPTGFPTGTSVGGYTVCNVEGTFTTDTTIPFVSGVAYKLEGGVNVGIDTGPDGADASGVPVDLTIEPGVLLFGTETPDYLVVNRGSRIIAEGTESLPIIMTSQLDLERQADADATNDLGADFDGEWGGLVLLGSAPTNRCITGTAYFTDSCQTAIEGISASTIYGGDDIDDDSGILRYVQVRFPGFEVSSGNELNGVSLGGVGNSTIMDYVQVYNSSDDGVEFFGGTVDVKHLVLVGNDDESIDTDNGYQGSVQYSVIIQTAGRGDNITEQSSVAGLPSAVSSNPILSNGTWIGTTADEVFKANSGSIGLLANTVIVYDGECIDWGANDDGFPGNGDNDGTWDGVGVDPSFHNTFFDCGNASTGTAGLTDDDPENAEALGALSAAGAGNVFDASDPSDTSNSLSASFFPGTTEAGVTAFADETTLDDALEAVDYIGAFDPNDASVSLTSNWATGWTFGIFNPVCPAGTTDSNEDFDGQNICIVTGGTITENLTLTRGNIYELDGRLNVGIDDGPSADAADGITGDPAVLNIEAGVTIFGNSGADYIVVSRGSEINALGTANNPIIMTSEADLRETQPDAADADGEWGGLVLLGRAPTNRCITGTAYFTDSCQTIIEGVDNPAATYGGDDLSDSTGTLRYLQVKYAGFEISSGNELNGISFGGVGDGTIVEYVQVHNNSDDGVEFFGGTVNVRYLVLTGNDDESIDTDNGYQGAIQYAIVIQTDGRGDNITEQSSVAGLPSAVSSNPKIANATLIGTNADELFKSNSGSIGQLINTVAVYDGECIDWGATDDGFPGNGDSDGTWDGVGVDPSFHNTFFDCGNASTGTAGLTDDDPENGEALGALNAAGAGNVFDSTGPSDTANTLFNTFVNGAAEAGVTAFASESTIDPFFEDVDYIGAVENANDTWWQGWSCGLETSDPC